MNLLLKSLLLPLLLLSTALPVQAEEDKWIDGIKIRVSYLKNLTLIYLPWEGKPSFSQLGASEAGRVGTKSNIIESRDDFSHLEDITLFPIAITLPEKLMNSWSFRGGFIEWHYSNEQDLPPYPDDDKQIIQSDTTNWRQNSSLRTSLYNNFFNASDKTFADANSNWALSADVTSSRIFLGYTWGVFIPIGEYHRFFKFGAGLGVYYIDLSLKLNLCSQLILTGTEGGRLQTECVGKTEIDSYSGKKLGIASTSSMTLWERRTKDSIWRFGSMSGGAALGSDDKGYIRVKLKNHSKSLALWMSSETWEIITYTYRF